jgi:hypothetical protein
MSRDDCEIYYRCINISSTIATLEEVANQFQVWRDNKKNSKGSLMIDQIQNNKILFDQLAIFLVPVYCYDELYLILLP